MVIECIDKYQIMGIYSINGKVEIDGYYMIIQFNFRHFKSLQLEKLALFNLAYFCHPLIKPKFPSRQNYPIYGMFLVFFYNLICFFLSQTKKTRGAIVT